MKREYYLTQFRDTFLWYGIIPRNGITIIMGALTFIFPIIIMNAHYHVSDLACALIFITSLCVYRTLDSFREINQRYSIYRKQKWQHLKLRLFKKDLSPLDIPNFIKFEEDDFISIVPNSRLFILNPKEFLDDDAFIFNFTYKGVDNMSNIILEYKKILYSFTVKEYLKMHTLNISIERRKEQYAQDCLESKSITLKQELKNSYVQQHIDDLKLTLKELQQ